MRNSKVFKYKHNNKVFKHMRNNNVFKNMCDNKNIFPRMCVYMYDIRVFKEICVTPRSSELRVAFSKCAHRDVLYVVRKVYCVWFLGIWEAGWWGYKDGKKTD